MAINITRTFTSAVTALTSWLDDNFTTIQNYINTNTTNDKWKDSVKCGGYSPSMTPGASQIPVLDASGNRSQSNEVIEQIIGGATRQYGGNDYTTLIKGKTLSMVSNAKYEAGSWQFIANGYATRLDLDITSQGAPVYYQSTVSNASGAGTALTWSAGQSIAFQSGGSVSQANTLKDIVSGLYRQASSTPGGNQIPVLDANGTLIINVQSASVAGVDITGTGAAGANIALHGDGITTPTKYIRVRGGNLEIVNSAGNAVIATLTDTGALTANSFVGNASSATTATNADGTGTSVYSEEVGLKIIRGTIAGDSSIVNGSGFTVTHVGTGIYRVNHNNPFSNRPSATANCYVFDGIRIFVNPTSSNSFTTFQTYDGSGVAADSEFCFIVIGPK